MKPARMVLVPVALLGATLLVLPVLAVTLPFLVVAWVTRVGAGWLRRQPPSAHWQQFVQYEPVVGWRPRPDLDLYGRADDVFHFTTGPDGWRGGLSVADADAVVFGDSYAFGHGASDDRMYTAFCDGLRVKPIGSDGYDMVQGLLWMERLAPDLTGKVVFWFVCYGNDLWDNLRPNTGPYRKPFVRRVDDDWEIVTGHVSPEPWPFPSTTNDNAALAELCCRSPSTDRVFSASEALLRRAQAICAEAGARLVVVGVPDRLQLTSRGRWHLARLAPADHPTDPNHPDKRLQEACERLEISFVPLTAHLSARHYLPLDIHWTTSGHRRVGALLQDLHQQLHR